MGKSTQTTASNQQTSPWGPQKPYLTQGFADAQTALNQANKAVAPNDFVAQMTPDQLATFRQMIGYGGNTATPGFETATGSDVLGAGAGGATGALNALGAFNPANWNNMSGVIGGAKAYAAGLDIPSAVRNAMLTGTQEARDVINPMTENAAASSGNTNSSRTGLQEGLVDRGLAEQAAGLAGSMYNNAYDTGAGISANQGGMNAQEALAALEGGGNLGSNLLSMGRNLIGGGINDVGNLFGLAEQGGAGEQQSQQSFLDNLLQRYQMQVSAPFAGLNQYWNIVGSNNWGSNSSGTSTTTSNPSALSTIGGLAFGLGNLFKLSDREAKEDITPVGHLFDGQVVYRYRYKGHPQWHIGLMAQDVETMNPDAVTEFDGYKYVNYLEATKHIR